MPSCGIGPSMPGSPRQGSPDSARRGGLCHDVRATQGERLRDRRGHARGCGTAGAAAHGANDSKAPYHHMDTALNRGAEEESIAERRTVTVRCDDTHTDVRVIGFVIAIVLRQLELTGPWAATRPWTSCGDRDLPPGQRRLGAHRLRPRHYPAEHAAPLPEQGGSRHRTQPRDTPKASCKHQSPDWEPTGGHGLMGPWIEAAGLVRHASVSPGS